MFAAAVGSVPASVALAQGVTQIAEPRVTPGWTLTPSIGYGQVADDNVLMQGKEAKDATASGDLLSVVAPSAQLDFNGQRGHLSAGYTGSFELYRQYDSLDNFSQFEAVSARRLMTSHTTVFAQQQFTMTPTTQLPALAGVPFARIGARVVGLRAGVEHSFNKHTKVSASYNYQKIAFNKDPVSGVVLIGGRGNGASAEVRHDMTSRTTLLVDYDLERASVLDIGASTIHNLRAGAEHKFSATSSVFGEAGVARLGPNALTPAHTGPSWQGGVAHQLRRARFDVTYSRSYVPSFGNGETLQSDDVGAHLRMTVSRRVYTQGSFDWRRDNPLPGAFTTFFGEQNMRTFVFSGLVGYPPTQWLRIEGFFSVNRQTVGRPGGDVDVNRVGIQVVTGKPMRLR
jgi:hypothetical protein